MGNVTAATHCLQRGCYPIHTHMHRATIGYFFPLTLGVINTNQILRRISRSVYTKTDMDGTAVSAPLRCILTQLYAAAYVTPCNRGGRFNKLFEIKITQVAEIQIYVDWPQTPPLFFLCFI